MTVRSRANTIENQAERPNGSTPAELKRLPVSIDEASAVPFYRQIVDQTAELVRSGQLAAETRLPSVRALAGQLFVSLITVRRAYADLEAMGLIARRQGQGTFVTGDGDASSRAAALDEARRLIADAVARARRLGLDGLALREELERQLQADRQEEREDNVPRDRQQDPQQDTEERDAK